MKVVTFEQKVDEVEMSVGEGEHKTREHCSQEAGNMEVDVKEEYGAWMLVWHKKAGAILRGTRGLSLKVGNGSLLSNISHSEAHDPQAQHSPTRTDIKSNHGSADGKSKKELQDISGAGMYADKVLLEKGDTLNPITTSSSRT